MQTSANPELWPVLIKTRRGAGLKDLPPPPREVVRKAYSLSFFALREVRGPSRFIGSHDAVRTSVPRCLKPGGRLMLRHYHPLCTLVLAACSSTGPSTVRPLTRIDPIWVTGRAAARLQPNGRFAIGDLVSPESGELAQTQAADLATVVVHDLASGVGGLAEAVQQQHGGSLDFRSLSRCNRVLWQKYPWVVAANGPQYLRNAYGNHFWFEFCTSSGVSALFQEVAANSGATVSNGSLVLPSGSGNDFFTSGIPLDGSWEVSPEVAVAALVQVLPRKVESIGDFTGCPLSTPPICSGREGYLWQLYVDRPIRVRRKSDQSELETTEFYLDASRASGITLRVMVPEAVQPTDQWWHGTTDSVLIVRRGPVLFSPVDVIGQ